MLKLPKENQHLVDIAPTFPLLAQIKYRPAQKGKKMRAIYSSTSFSTYFVHMMRTLQLCGRVGMEDGRFLAGPRGQVRAGINTLITDLIPANYQLNMWHMQSIIEIVYSKKLLGQNDESIPYSHTPSHRLS